MEGPILQIQEELLLAKQSRIEGNEGRARVCARRAAGAAAHRYLLTAGITDQPENVMESLHSLRSVPNLPARVITAVDRLTQKVDLDYNLPPDVDLIIEAETVIQYIIAGEYDPSSPDS
jgi:hypothetical protein